MVLRRGLGNVSCTFMCTTCIYDPGCRVELHKTHLHPAGPSSQADVTDLWPGGFASGARTGKRERLPGSTSAVTAKQGWVKMHEINEALQGKRGGMREAIVMWPLPELK